MTTSHADPQDKVWLDMGDWDNPMVAAVVLFLLAVVVGGFGWVSGNLVEEVIAVILAIAGMGMVIVGHRVAPRHPNVLLMKRPKG